MPRAKIKIREVTFFMGLVKIVALLLFSNSLWFVSYSIHRELGRVFSVLKNVWNSKLVENLPKI